ADDADRLARRAGLGQQVAHALDHAVHRRRITLAVGRLDDDLAPVRLAPAVDEPRQHRVLVGRQTLRVDPQPDLFGPAVDVDRVLLCRRADLRGQLVARAAGDAGAQAQRG